MRLAIDIDDVVADLVPVWLDRYNQAWGDTLQLSQITSWDLAKFTKPGSDIYEYLKPEYDLYRDVQPVADSLDAIRELETQYDIVYVTAAVTPAKIEWMQRFDLISRGKTLDRRFIVCSDKRLINADIIIDDKAETVFQWPSPKTGILFAKPWNNVRMWPERLQRLDGWSEVLDYLSLRTLDESRRFYAEYGA